jgi:hypothetical protein
MLAPVSVVAEVGAVHEPHIGGTTRQSDLDDLAPRAIAEIVLE